jgi:hypothetical protein
MYSGIILAEDATAEAKLHVQDAEAQVKLYMKSEMVTAIYALP